MLPLFPLGTVLVPHLVLPLHVFEPRYRTMMSHLLDREPDEREFGIVAIRRGHEVGPGAAADIHDIGTTAFVQEATELPDGRFEVITVGHRRFRILDIDDSLPYRQAHVEFLEEPEGEIDDHLLATTREAFVDYRRSFESETTPDELRQSLPPEPVVLSYLIASALAVSTDAQQRLLELPDAAARLRQERALLRRERILIDVLPSLPVFEPDRTPSVN